MGRVSALSCTIACRNWWFRTDSSGRGPNPFRLRKPGPFEIYVLVGGIWRLTLQYRRANIERKSRSQKKRDNNDNYNNDCLFQVLYTTNRKRLCTPQIDRCNVAHFSESLWQSRISNGVRRDEPRQAAGGRWRRPRALCFRINRRAEAIKRTVRLWSVYGWRTSWYRPTSH